MIPLLPDAADAFRRALERAAKQGAFQPSHFIFPLKRNRYSWDPTKPASKNWMRWQCEILRERTGIAHINPHKWRHQLCTELFEAGRTRDEVIALMGWASEKMVETYSHARIEAKLKTLNSIAPQPEGEAKRSNIFSFPRR